MQNDQAKFINYNYDKGKFMKNLIFLSGSLLLLPVRLIGEPDMNKNNVQLVEQVDLNRYVGLWYEIAKIPNRFQKQCVKNTTAQYAIRSDGRIDVVNRCMKENGFFDEAKGIAKIVDLFWGNYWIIGLDNDYQWAVVGEPTRKYGWVLGRSTALSDNQWENVHAVLLKNGYNPDDFVKTEHD